MGCGRREEHDFASEKIKVFPVGNKGLTALQIRRHKLRGCHQPVAQRTERSAQRVQVTSTALVAPEQATSAPCESHLRMRTARALATQSCPVSCALRGHLINTTARGRDMRRTGRAVRTRPLSHLRRPSFAQTAVAKLNCSPQVDATRKRSAAHAAARTELASRGGGKGRDI